MKCTLKIHEYLFTCAVVFIASMTAGIIPIRTANAVENNCAYTRSILTNYLEYKFSEVPKATGLTRDGNVLEVLASKDEGWTIIVTLPTGESCAVAAGEGWYKIPVDPDREQSDPTTPPTHRPQNDDDMD